MLSKSLKVALHQVFSFCLWILGMIFTVLRAVGIFFSVGFVFLVYSLCSDGMPFFPSGLAVLVLAFLMSPFGIPMVAGAILSFLNDLNDKLISGDVNDDINHRSKV